MNKYKTLWDDLKSQVVLLATAPWESSEARGVFSDVYTSMLEMEAKNG